MFFKIMALCPEWHLARTFPGFMNLPIPAGRKVFGLLRHRATPDLHADSCLPRPAQVMGPTLPFWPKPASGTKTQRSIEEENLGLPHKDRPWIPDVTDLNLSKL